MYTQCVIFRILDGSGLWAGLVKRPNASKASLVVLDHL